MIERFFARKWIVLAWQQWRFALLVLLPQVFPPYTAHGYRLSDWGMVNAYILTHPIKPAFGSFFLVFQVLPLVFLVAIPFADGKITRLFSAYVALSYFVIAPLQSISTGEKYGFSVCTANLVTFLILGGLWLGEAIFPQNRFEKRTLSVKCAWLILLAFIAFWGPVNPLTLAPDFKPVYLLTSGTGLSFCMVTPLFLAIVAAYFPHVNKPLFAATALTALFLSLGNVLLEFVIYPAYWWIGVLHIPLFVTSAYGVGLSFFDMIRQGRDIRQVKG